MKRSAAVPYHPISASTEELFNDCLSSPVCLFLEDHQEREEPRTRNSRRLQHSVGDNNDQDAISSIVTIDEVSSDGELLTLIDSNSPITDEFTNSSTETILNADDSYQFSNSTSSPEDLPPPEKKFRRMQVGVGNSTNAPSQATTATTTTTSASTNGRSVGERLKEKQKELLANNHVNNNSNNHSLPSCSNSVRTSRTTLPSENKQKRVLPELTERQRNTLRVITQYLKEIGMHDTVETLADESGCRAENPLATRLREDIRVENWADALEIIDKFKDKIKNKDYLTLRAALVEELMKSYITKGDFLAVLICLQKEYPREKEFGERRKYFAQLLADDPEEISKHFQTQHDTADYKSLMTMLENLLPANFLLGPSRLDDLLHQSWETQIRKCHLHVGKTKINRDDISILRDHRCPTVNFPSRTIQIIEDHETEVWTLKFSPCGEYLASAGKSGIVYIWKVEDETKLAYLHRFVLHEDIDGIGSLSWSSDSRYLACGATEHRTIGVYLFDVSKCIPRPDGRSYNEFIKMPSDKFSVASFFPTPGRKFVCGDQKGNFAQFDMDLELNDKRNDFEGFRIRSLVCLKDGKTVLAADTLNRIRAYDFEKRMDHLLIQETSPIIAFTVDAREKHCLITTKDHGIRMWCLDTHTLVQSFFGSIHSELVVAACFGGINDIFVASGSEKNNRIMIWKRNEKHPIKYLDGHKRGVNAVAWNPKYKNMLVSGSDDHTIRVWSTPSKSNDSNEKPLKEVLSKPIKDTKPTENPEAEKPKTHNGRSKTKKKVN
jgi:WD40 repeat protein